MELIETLARIIINSETRQVKDLSLFQKHFRFKCGRCATFCCRLGGPKLARKDVERIEEAGYLVKDFLEPTNGEFKDLPTTPGNLKNREDGSCIFLKFDAKQNRYQCSIYDFRPILCKLYPFDFERVGSNIVVLKVIPCCRGLNNSNGKLVDESFIINHLLPPLVEALCIHALERLKTE